MSQMKRVQSQLGKITTNIKKIRTGQIFKKANTHNKYLEGKNVATRGFQ